MLQDYTLLNVGCYTKVSWVLDEIDMKIEIKLLDINKYFLALTKIEMKNYKKEKNCRLVIVVFFYLNELFFDLP